MKKHLRIKQNNYINEYLKKKMCFVLIFWLNSRNINCILIRLITQQKDVQTFSNIFIDKLQTFWTTNISPLCR